MGLHRGAHFYALCSHDDERGCTEFLLPDPTADPTGYGTIIAGQCDVFTLAAQRGWQIPASKDDDTWLCPQHRTRPDAKPVETIQGNAHV